MVTVLFAAHILPFISLFFFRIFFFYYYLWFNNLYENKYREKQCVFVYSQKHITRLFGINYDEIYFFFMKKELLFSALWNSLFTYITQRKKSVFSLFVFIFRYLFLFCCYFRRICNPRKNGDTRKRKKKWMFK